MKSERACCLKLFGKWWEYKKKKKKRLRGRGSFHNTSSSLFNNTYSSPIPMGSFSSWVTDKHRKGCRIRGEGWKGAHPHSREEALPTNNMGHRFPGQTVSWWSTGMPGLNQERRWQRRKSFYHISSRDICYSLQREHGRTPQSQSPSDWRYGFGVVMLYQTSPEPDLSPTLAFSCE